MRGLSIRTFGIAFFITGLLFAVVEKTQLNLDMFGIKTFVQQSNSKEIKRLEQELAVAKQKIQILEEQRVAQVKPTTTIEPVKPVTEPKTQQQKQQKQKQSEIYKLNIYPNMPVVTIAKKLKEAGIIQNTTELETYLAKDKYNKKVQAGEFELKKGMTIKDIADTITRNTN